MERPGVQRSRDQLSQAGCPWFRLRAAAHQHADVVRGRGDEILSVASCRDAFWIAMVGQNSVGIGTGRSPAADLVAELGADEFVDIDRGLGHEHNVDLVVDLVGGEALHQAQQVLGSGGKIVSLVEDQPVPRRRDDLRGIFFIVEPRSSELTELGRRIEAGELRPVIGQVVQLADGHQAFGAKRAGRVPGKSVLEVRR